MGDFLFSRLKKRFERLVNIRAVLWLANKIFRCSARLRMVRQSGGVPGQPGLLTHCPKIDIVVSRTLLPPCETGTHDLPVSLYLQHREDAGEQNPGLPENCLVNKQFPHRKDKIHRSGY